MHLNPSFAPAFDQVKAKKGGLDILVVSAGFVEMAPMAAVTPEHFDKTFA